MTNRREPHRCVSLTRRRRAAAIAGAAIALVSSTSTTLSAHERRLVGLSGEYTVVVGFRSEPPFEDEVNAAEIIVVRTADQRPINAASGDIVDLTVEVQLRRREAFDAETIQAATLEKPSQGFGTTNRYYSFFRPTVDGAYAFRVRGTVSDASAPIAGSIEVDETYVCGGGSLGAGAFNCIRDPQSFPKGAADSHGHDRHGYFDDDSLRQFRHEPRN